MPERSGVMIRSTGIACIATVVLLWVGSSEFIQLIFDSATLSFESPLILTFYSTSLFSLYLVGFCFCPSWRGVLPAQHETSERQDEPLLPASGLETPPGGSAEGVRSSLSAADTARLAVKLAPSWLVANWSFNASLCQTCGTGTSVANVTLISTTASVFTLFFSVVFLSDAFSLLKLACALLNFGGIALVLAADGSSSSSEQTPKTIGDVLAVISAACMAGYSVQLKAMLPPPSAMEQVSMPMFFGFLGVTVALMCVPLFLTAIALHSEGWTHLELVRQLWAQPRVVLALTVNGLVGTVLSDLVWAQAVMLTSPLITNLGTGFTVPLSFLVDYYLRGVGGAPQPQYVLGVGMILVAFVTVNCLETRAAQAQQDTQMPAMFSDMASEEIDAVHLIGMPRSPTGDQDIPISSPESDACATARQEPRTH